MLKMMYTIAHVRLGLAKMIYGRKENWYQMFLTSKTTV